MAEHVRSVFRIGPNLWSAFSLPGLEPFEFGHQPVFNPGYFYTIERFERTKKCGVHNRTEAKYKWLFSRSGLLPDTWA
jgi:hypothetical protein